MLLTESSRELFTAVATCAAGLTGLLFVAISVGPREGVPDRPAVIQQIRAASALLAFTNALAVSLFGLVSENSAGYAAISSGSIGILFIAASVRSIVTSPDVSAEQAWRQAGLIVLLFAAFGGELACGIGLISNDTAVFGPDVPQLRPDRPAAGGNRARLGTRRQPGHRRLGVDRGAHRPRPPPGRPAAPLTTMPTRR